MQPHITSITDDVMPMYHLDATSRAVRELEVMMWLFEKLELNSFFIHFLFFYIDLKIVNAPPAPATASAIKGNRGEPSFLD